MRRREFITAALSGMVLSQPVAVHAQRTSNLRTVGIIMPYPETDVAMQDRTAIFRQELRNLGWRTGDNLQFNERWTTDDMDRIRGAVAELVASKPDVILAVGGRVVPVVHQQTRSIPVVFLGTSDPVWRGLVASLAQPGGNITGFALSEIPNVQKLLEILREVAPRVRRVAMIFNPDNPVTPQNIEVFNEVAAKLALEPSLTSIRQATDIERAIEAHAQEPDGGLVLPSDLTLLAQRNLIVAAAARHRLPAAYADRAIVTDGGLISYSADRNDQFLRSAEYVNRILHGQSPAELPVQRPTKYELAINIRTAQSLGLVVPTALLARADVVID